MATQEEISIKASKGKEKYDAVVKRNMSFPKCLAPILQTVIPEYKKYSMEDVLGFIVNESIANDDAVDDCSATLHKMDTEMSSDTEKPIRDDLRFKTLNPELCDRKMEMNVYFHIDLEVQNNYTPFIYSKKNKKYIPYPIIKRGLYYAARELSSQLGILTGEDNYASLEKVYSIWICNENIPEELQNTVTLYQIGKKDIIGETHDNKSDYDLLTVIIIRRGKVKSDEPIFDYLNAFFSGDIDGICKYINIKDDSELMKGVRTMQGLGATIEREAKKEGRIEGRIEGKIEVLISMVKEGILKPDIAAHQLDMSEKDFLELMQNYDKGATNTSNVSVQSKIQND